MKTNRIVVSVSDENPDDLHWVVTGEYRDEKTGEDSIVETFAHRNRRDDAVKVAMRVGDTLGLPVYDADDNEL